MFYNLSMNNIKCRLTIHKRLVDRHNYVRKAAHESRLFLDTDRLRWHSEAFQQEKRADKATKQRDFLLQPFIDNGIVDY